MSATTMCEVCACEVRTDDTMCAICRRFARKPEPLEGGYWERDGLVMRWVQVDPVSTHGSPACGTDAGYEAHKRHGEQTCDECRAAHAAKRAARRAKANTPPLKPCGTRTAYQRHRARGEVPCEPCIEAERDYQRERRRNQKEAA